MKNYRIVVASSSITYWIYEIDAENEEKAREIVLSGNADDKVLQHYTDINYDDYDVDTIEEITTKE